MLSKNYYRNFIHKRLFNGDINFSKKYFSFFWGNMDVGGIAKSKAGAVETFVGGMYHATRKSEVI